jgi:hypothetical protein
MINIKGQKSGQIVPSQDVIGMIVTELLQVKNINSCVYIPFALQEE